MVAGKGLKKGSCSRWQEVTTRPCTGSQLSDGTRLNSPRNGPEGAPSLCRDPGTESGITVLSSAFFSKQLVLPQYRPTVTPSGHLGLPQRFWGINLNITPNLPPFLVLPCLLPIFSKKKPFSANFRCCRTLARAVGWTRWFYFCLN